MRIHREGRGSLQTVSAALLIFNAIVALAAVTAADGRPLIVTLPLSLLVIAFFLNFFRNPVRVSPHDPAVILSPADGTIVAIETVIEREYFHNERLKSRFTCLR